ncbi:TonB-dependent receptor domain-containing protein [Hufsiella ginkgonis]|uniref:TonB-dependent receptor n=1 Tax=Hufsiella ginkgonis TaxID=2695274 RepID=A0A7K1XW20_9SPHI|nr:TonB-dependent receptor [Hufsiella ginkgonis]MXV15171.1 TonB-dependent receptor [Hufsiella ginkgonis]
MTLRFRIVIRSLAFYLLFLLSVTVSAQAPAVLDQPISLALQNEPLPAALVKLQNLVKGDFAYDPQIVPAGKLITLKFDKRPLAAVLDELLSGTGLNYHVINNAVVISSNKPKAFTINGHVLDRYSGEPLIGATIYLPDLQTGVVSNQYGFYSLTLPEASYRLSVSSLGFSGESQKISLQKNIVIDFRLSARVYSLSDVPVGLGTADSAYLLSAVGSLPVEKMKFLPYYDGEVDLVKAIQMQNGVKAITEGSGGLFIKGGNSDQNLITLDEAMVYNPSHLYGLVSVFNSDAIKKIQVFDDHIPSNYGGRLSSVIDVRMADGNNKEFHVKGGANLLSMHLAAEGPVRREKGSFIITGRRSLTDIFNADSRVIIPNSNYYDLNAKANYQLNNSNKVFYSFYLGNDRLFSKNSYNNNWGNITSTFRWNHKFGSRTFLNLSAIFSHYENNLDVNADTLSEKYVWKTGIEDLSLKGDFTFYKSVSSEVKFGGITTLHRVVPGEASTAFPSTFNIPRNRAWETALYFSHQLWIRKKLQAKYGLRAGQFANAEDRTDVFDTDGNALKVREHKTYYGLEPRIYLAWSVAADQRLHAAYNRNYQYLQLIQNSELTFSSLESWLPASAKTKPQRADYWSLGYDYLPGGNKALLNVYYKKFYNQADLLNHTQIIKNPLIRDQLRTGTSQAYGAEISVSKITSGYLIEASYNYSRVFRKITDINDGLRFRASYDVPHDFKLSQTYLAPKRWSASAFFNLTSGRVVTLPVGYFVQDGLNVPLFEGRNRSRFPLFHRLDLSAQFRLSDPARQKQTFNHEVSFGVYNAYNKKNPLFYRISQPGEGSARFERTSGIVPWVAYNFKL